VLKKLGNCLRDVCTSGAVAPPVEGGPYAGGGGTRAVVL
jgi:hypothetical protein